MNLKDYEKVFEEGKEQVDAELRQGYDSFEYVDHSVCLETSNSKYKVGSALQKAVRRGHADLAAKFAQAIHNSSESDYVWHRLIVIAFEDVGVANIPMLAQMCHAARFKTVRSQYDGARLASYLAHSLASGVKSRSFTEASCTTRGTSRAADETLTLETLTDLEKYCGAAKNAYNWFAPNAPVNYIKELTDGLFNKKDVYALVLEHLDNIPKPLQPHYKYAFVCGSKISVEKLNCPMGYIASQVTVQSIAEMKYIETDTSQYEIIGKVPDYAWDYHVREGGAAFRKFHNFVKRKVDFPVSLSCLQECLFLTNISVLDKELVYPNSQKIKMDSYIQYLTNNGLPEDKFDGFIALLLTDEFQDKLLQCKRECVQ